MCFQKEKKQVVQIKFGVPYFDVFDSRFPDFGVPVAVRGVLSFQIKSYKKLVKTYGYGDIAFDEFISKVRTSVIGYVKNYIISLTTKHKLSIFQIESNVLEMAELLKEAVVARFKKEYQLAVANVDITAIEIDKTSDGYYQLKNLTQDQTMFVTQAETAVYIQDLLDKQRAEAENYRERLQVERENLKNDKQIEKLKKMIVVGGCVAGIIIVGLVVLLIFL